MVTISTAPHQLHDHDVIIVKENKKIIFALIAGFLAVIIPYLLFFN
tara:strand:- start:493 stop:630 length:138 start_codon:yes stop_codon:yes gene_type:complete